MAARRERGPTALSPLRTVALAIGFACAISASVLIFVTENAQYLRIGILVALWGFVFAALAASRKQVEQAVAAGSEVELRKSYEMELEREVAARREYELRLEAQLRRELQESFTAQVGGLHEELVGLRRELSEQWDSELRVERMVMRTQSVRMGSDRRGSLDRGSGPTIEAAPIDAIEHLDEEPAEPPAGTLAQSVQPAGKLAQTWKRAEQPTQATGPAGRPAEGPSTVEVPVVRDSAPSVPTMPVPPASVAAAGRTPGRSNGDTASAGPSQVQERHTHAESEPVRAPAAGHTPALARESDRVHQSAPVSEPAAVSEPAVERAQQPWPAKQPEPANDVLARILADAGATVGGRRHRYTDEDEDAVPARS